MAKLVFSSLCLVAVCTLPGGDSANLSLQRHPLDVRQLSDSISARMARSVLAARVVDLHGDPVNLRSNGQPARRTVISPFVTSHGRVTSQRRVTSPGRQQKKLPSVGPRRNHNKPQIRRRTAPTMPKPRQTLPGSRGFATFNGQRFDIRPIQGLVPFNSLQTRTNHHRSNNAPANKNRRNNVRSNQRRVKTLSTNQRGRLVSSSNRRSPAQQSNTSQHSRRPNSAGKARTSFSTPSTRRPFNSHQQNSRPRAVKHQRPQQRPRQRPQHNDNSQHSSRNITNLRPTSNVPKRPTPSVPMPDFVRSVFEQGLEAHMPPNARNMETFLIKKSQQPGHYHDSTKGTGTLFTSHPGQCPLVDQSRCAPFLGPQRPPSCSNDYQCHGEENKCCYDPCLVTSKCVRPVNG